MFTHKHAVMSFSFASPQLCQCLSNIKELQLIGVCKHTFVKDGHALISSVYLYNICLPRS